MRKLVYCLVVGITCVAAPSVSHAEEIFIARLTGAAEVPPSATDGRGFAVVAINDTADEIAFFVVFDNLEANAISSHIHAAPPGMDGAIIFDMGAVPPETGGYFFGTLTSADFTPGGGVDTFAEALDAIRSGGTYVNVHSTLFPGGEIRGQLREF